jgi:hypothetical protein
VHCYHLVKQHNTGLRPQRHTAAKGAERSEDFVTAAELLKGGGEKQQTHTAARISSKTYHQVALNDQIQSQNQEAEP